MEKKGGFLKKILKKYNFLLLSVFTLIVLATLSSIFDYVIL